MSTRKHISDFKEARSYVRDLGLKNWEEWVKYCSSGKKPNEIPSNPNKSYKKFGWIGWNDWLNSTNKQYGKKYTVNENFFKKWSHDMAYILGLWFADGCVYGKYNNYFNISLHRDDVELLIKVKESMQSNHKIYFAKNMSILVIGSKEIYSDIIRLGGIPRKSLTVSFPSVPDMFINDFIRGLWDGDGCIYYSKRHNDYLSSIMSGNGAFIEDLLSCLRKKIPSLKGSITQSSTFLKKYNKEYKNRFVISFGIEDTRKLSKFLGYNSGLCLNRKKDKFLKTDCPQKYLPYEEAEAAYRKIGIKNREEWYKKHDMLKITNIPKYPQYYYKKQWKGWREWNKNYI